MHELGWREDTGNGMTRPTCLRRGPAAVFSGSPSPLSSMLGEGVKTRICRTQSVLGGPDKSSLSKECGSSLNESLVSEEEAGRRKATLTYIYAPAPVQMFKFEPSKTPETEVKTLSPRIE